MSFRTSLKRSLWASLLNYDSNKYIGILRWKLGTDWTGFILKKKHWQLISNALMQKYSRLFKLIWNKVPSRHFWFRKLKNIIWAKFEATVIPLPTTSHLSNYKEKTIKFIGILMWMKIRNMLDWIYDEMALFLANQ